MKNPDIKRGEQQQVVEEGESKAKFSYEELKAWVELCTIGTGWTDEQISVFLNRANIDRENGRDKSWVLKAVNTLCAAAFEKNQKKQQQVKNQ